MHPSSTRNVAIVGASSKKDRYAHMAQELLMEKGYKVIPVSARDKEILGIQTIDALNKIQGPVDTVTLYVGPQRQHEIIQQIIVLKPRRVIFNPGTENPEAYDLLDNAGIDYEEACTLVLLRTRQF